MENIDSSSFLHLNSNTVVSFRMLIENNKWVKVAFSDPGYPYVVSVFLSGTSNEVDSVMVPNSDYSVNYCSSTDRFKWTIDAW
jgi:hypothetical protein